MYNFLEEHTCLLLPEFHFFSPMEPASPAGDALLVKFSPPDGGDRGW